MVRFGRIADEGGQHAADMERGVGTGRDRGNGAGAAGKVGLVLLDLVAQAVQAGLLGGGFGGERGRRGGSAGVVGIGVAGGSVVGGAQALGVEGILDFVADLGPDDDPGEGA